MIKKIDNYDISMCYGGRGECHCGGTDEPSEKIFGVFRKITENEKECIHWCLEVKKGTRWKFLSNDHCNLLHSLGFGGHWNSISLGTHVKLS